VKRLGILLAFIFLGAVSALSQEIEVRAHPLSEDDIRLMREDVQSMKNAIVSNAMQFTDAESHSFWPVYREYSQEQQVLAKKRLDLITEYAQNLDRMEDTRASSLTQRFLHIEDETQALRRKYLPIFTQAIGAKRAAKFYQVDNRLTMIVNFQLAAEIPLIP
jgi:hypothetical protein